jgi:AraC-like DNA-binding protein
MSNQSPRYKYETKSRKIEHRDHSDGKGHLQCSPHLHRELELVYMLEGETVAYADSVQTVLHAGDVFLTFPNQIHFYKTYTTEKYFIFIIKPDLMPEFMDTFTMAIPTSPVIKNAAALPHVDQLLRLLLEVCVSTKEESGYSETLKRGCLLSLFSELLSHMDIQHPTFGDSGALRSIISFCTQNFSENLSLSLLEEKLHLNKYYISHLFSGKLGLRFNDYINSLRISEACKLLTNSSLSITDISEQVGFNTLRTFNRAFAKQTGFSPTEYRKLDPAMRKF